MAKDLTAILEDRPGTLAAACEALGNAGVNIDGLCGVPSGGKAEIHFLVQDAAAARRALEGAGVRVAGERDVLVLDVPDRPGAVGEIARRIANAGVNVELVYAATKTRVVFGVNDLAKARAAIV